VSISLIYHSNEWIVIVSLFLLFIIDKTVTFTAGLFSSLLSASVKRCGTDIATAKLETQFLQTLLRNIVSTVNLAVFIARQWENLAVRMVFESKILNQETKKKIFRNFLYADEKGKRAKYGTNGAVKLHRWFMKAVLGTSKKKARGLNPNGKTFFSQHGDLDPFEGFSADGQVSDIWQVLSALPDDPFLKELHNAYNRDKTRGKKNEADEKKEEDEKEEGDEKEEEDERDERDERDEKDEKDQVMGNVILAARRLWCQGYEGKWDEFPELPTSRFLTRQFEEISRVLDRDTVASLVTNFLDYQEKYICRLLGEWRKNNPSFDLEREKSAPELLCYLIDLLPLSGRPDLVELKTRLGVDNSPQLQEFIMQRRQELATMMGVKEIYQYDRLENVDDSKVDMRLALGFGDEKCVQADFLIPAILGMAAKIGLPVKVIPDARPSHCPIIFNSVGSRVLLSNLPALAEKYGMDISVAEAIGEKFEEKTRGLSRDSVEFDLATITFLFTVSFLIPCRHLLTSNTEFNESFSCP